MEKKLYEFFVEINFKPFHLILLYIQPNKVFCHVSTICVQHKFLHPYFLLNCIYDKALFRIQNLCQILVNIYISAKNVMIIKLHFLYIIHSENQVKLFKYYLKEIFKIVFECSITLLEFYKTFLNLTICSLILRIVL